VPPSQTQSRQPQQVAPGKALTSTAMPFVQAWPRNAA
jgi:hypothetical protein